MVRANATKAGDGEVGARIRSIRGDETGAAFVGRLNEAAVAAGFRPYWTTTKLSNVENGIRGVTAADAACVAHLDPKQRGSLWIQFGVEPHRGESDFEALVRTARRRRA